MKRIFRVVKDKNYSTIHNGFLNCKSLSWGAKGLFTYILSKPDHWNINLNELCTHSTNGISSTRGFYKELLDAGYILKITTRESGKFVTQYQIFEKPELNPNFAIVEENLFSETNNEKPTTKNRESKTAHGEPQSVDRTLVITELESTKKEKTERVNTQNLKIKDQEKLIDRVLDLPEFIDEVGKIFQRYYDLHLGGQKFYNNDIWILHSLHSLTGGDVEVIQDKILDGWKNDKYFGVEANNVPPNPKLLEKHFNRFVKKTSSKTKSFDVISQNLRKFQNPTRMTAYDPRAADSKDLKFAGTCFGIYSRETDLIQGYYPVRWLKEVWGLSESFIRNESIMKDWIQEFKEAQTRAHEFNNNITEATA